MHIRKAEICDLERMMEMINQAKVELGKTSDQWQNGYPNIQTLEEDIRKSVSYVLVDEHDFVVGTAAMIDGEDSNYAHIEGAWHTDKTYLVIHRIAIGQEYKGQGLAHYFFAWAKEHSQVIRIDTHEKNVSMQRAILKEGFTYCGIVYVGVNEPRFAYDWVK